MAAAESCDVAKKNTSENAPTPAAPKRAATRRTTKPAGAIATAADAGGNGSSAAYRPSADEIAQLAYQRYLSRGGTDGRDFDDWIEAERELARRHTER
jgi:hypothetical protein